MRNDMAVQETRYDFRRGRGEDAKRRVTNCREDAQEREERSGREQRRRAPEQRRDFCGETTRKAANTRVRLASAESKLESALETLKYTERHHC